MNEALFLPPAEAVAVLEALKKAFPAYQKWKHCNDPTDDEHDGYAAWGSRVYGRSPHTTRFYVTADRSQNGWHVYWSVGQHVFMWTSADCGDAILASSRARIDLGAAIAELKSQVAALAGAVTEGSCGPAR